MTDHVMLPIPDVDEYVRKGGWYISNKPHMACINCGMLDLQAAYQGDCDRVQASVGMAVFRAGGKWDPFASMRSTAPQPQGSTLGSMGIGMHGMPIRRELTPETGYIPAAIAKRETRPGLVTEQIDRNEYDKFMKENFR